MLMLMISTLRPQRYAKTNTQRVMIFTNTHFFPIWSIIAVQYEDGVPQIHSTVEEMSDSGHQRQSYIINFIKTGRLIMHNMRHISSTPITREQYLREQIKRDWMVRDIFTDARSLKWDRVFHPYTAHTCCITFFWQLISKTVPPLKTL